MNLKPPQIKQFQPLFCTEVQAQMACCMLVLLEEVRK